MNLADIIRQARDKAPRDPSGRLQTDWLMWRDFVNNRYRQILNKTRWSFLQKTATFSTVAPYNTGTISTIAGSTTVTGSGTVWTSALVGAYLTVSGNPFLKITAVGGATSLTLESGYPTTQTAATYSIVQPIYALNNDYWYPIDFINQWRLLGPYPWRAFDRVDPYRQERGAPWAFSMFGRSTDAFSTTPSALPAMQVELWPVPDLTYIIRYRYIYLVPDLALGTDVPVFPNPTLLIYGAIADSFGYFASVMGQPKLTDGAKPWEDMFNNLLDGMVDRDEPNQNIPRTQEANLPFVVSDDLLYKLGQPLPAGAGYYG